NAIIGYSEMLQEEALEEDKQGMHSDLQKIHNSARHLLSLINDILDLSKIEAGKMTLHPQPFKVQSVVEEIALSIQPIVAKNSNRLEINYRSDTGTMKADVLRVRQILLNLLSNATKFTENGTILLDVARTLKGNDEWITFRVTDTGIGMNADQMRNLFHAFSQGDPSIFRNYGGTGLGLVISRRF